MHLLSSQSCWCWGSIVIVCLSHQAICWAGQLPVGLWRGSEVMGKRQAACTVQPAVGLVSVRGHRQHLSLQPVRSHPAARHRTASHRAPANHAAHTQIWCGGRQRFHQSEWRWDPSRAACLWGGQRHGVIGQHRVSLILNPDTLGEISGRTGPRQQTDRQTVKQVCS